MNQAIRRMRILILTQFFHPEPGPRVHELAAELVSRGHEVSVITGFPTYPRPTFYEEYPPRIFRRDWYQGARVLRVPHFPHGQDSTAKRMLNYGSFMVSSMTLGNLLTEGADCMYVFLPPPLLGLSAGFIKLTRSIPFIYDIQDIWPDAAAATGMIRNRWLIGAIEGLERLIYPLSAAISVPSPGYKRRLVEKGVCAEKVEVIPNWAEESAHRPVPYDKEFAAKYGLENGFNVTFAGNLGLAQALETVVDAARELQTHKEIRFVVAGDGVAFDSLKERAKSFGLTNVLFLGRLPQEAMGPLFSVSDLLLVHLKKNPVFEITIPSKTQAYMASGRPILMAVEGDGAELIESTGSGLACRQEDPRALAGCVLEFLGMDPARRRAMGESGRQVFLERFTKGAVIEKFERLLAWAAGRKVSVGDIEKRARDI